MCIHKGGGGVVGGKVVIPQTLNMQLQVRHRVYGNIRSVPVVTWGALRMWGSRGDHVGMEELQNDGLREGRPPLKGHVTVTSVDWFSDGDFIH